MVSESRAPLVTPTAAELLRERRAPGLGGVATAPPPRASMSGAASFVANQGPRTLVSKVWRRWLGREARALRGRCRPRAALLTRMSRPEWLSLMAAKRARIWSRLPMSARRAGAGAPGSVGPRAGRAAG